MLNNTKDFGLQGHRQVTRPLFGLSLSLSNTFAVFTCVFNLQYCFALGHPLADAAQKE